MFKQIRMLLSDNSSNIENGGNPLNDTVEVDETFVGGKGKNSLGQNNIFQKVIIA